MLNFPCPKMQMVWDKLADKLPDNLYVLVATNYLLDCSQPKGSIFDQLLGYSQCLKDNHLSNINVENFIRAMLLKNVVNW